MEDYFKEILYEGQQIIRESQSNHIICAGSAVSDGKRSDRTRENRRTEIHCQTDGRDEKDSENHPDGREASADRKKRQ